MRAFRLVLLSITAILLLALPALAASSQTDADTQRDLTQVLDRLQDVITQLAAQDSLTRTETDDLRRELAGLYQQLEQVHGRVAGYTGTDEDYRADAWTRFGDASLSVSPHGARFSGWSRDNHVTMDYEEPNTIVLTVRNGTYVATWRLRNAYSGGVKTTVTTQTNGDLVLSVDDSAGSHDYLIKDGGLGPVYVRGNLATVPSTGPTRAASTWYRPWREAVDRGELATSSGMDWLIQQYQDNAYVSDKVQALGDLLRGLDGQPGASDGIGRLYFYRNGERFYYDIPDPRRAPSDFAFITSKLYDLERNGDWYEINPE